MGKRKPSIFARLERVRRFVGPVIALGSGFVSVLLLRRGLEFAPVAVAAILLAWTIVGGLSRLFSESKGESGARKVGRWFLRYLVSTIYQDVLFFLLPIWFGSATWPSPNVAVPILLGLLAIFSCFDVHYDRFVLQHPILRTSITALILFSTLLAAMPVLVSTSLRPNVAVAAAVSTIAGGVAILPREKLLKTSGIAGLVALTLAASGAAIAVAPILPPVPVQKMRSEAALSIENREPAGASHVFAAGVERVYVWFAVAAPRRFSEAVRFRWFYDDRPLGKEFETSINGGRQAGFRTWGYISLPKPGRWRAELIAESGQLIGRESFEVIAN